MTASRRARLRLVASAGAALCALVAAPLGPTAGAVTPATGIVVPTFTSTTGDLKVAVTGLPSGVRATVKVYKKKTLVATLTPQVGTPALKAKLLPGTYDVRTTAITTRRDGRLVPTTTSRTVTIAKAKLTSATFAFKWGVGVTSVLKVAGTTSKWAFVSTSVKLTLTITNRSKSMPLRGVTLVIPKDVPALSVARPTVPATRGPWAKTVTKCATTATCSSRVTLAPAAPTNTTRYLRYGQSVSVVLTLTTPSKVGTRTIGVLPVGAFTIDGAAPSLRVVKGETVPATPGTPIPTQETTVPVVGSTTVLKADLPNGAYGPVSVYYEPAACSLGATGSCVTATVDGTFSKDGVHLYGFGMGETPQEQLPPASLTITCDVSDCPEVGEVTAVAAGTKHTCAVRAPGTVWCFGNNGNGQLGTPANIGVQTSAVPTPVQVSGMTGVTALATGHVHTCVVRTGGNVWCWGGNGFGQTGIPNSPLPANQPRQVPGVTGATAVSTGEKHTCAVATGGTVWCWGNNRYGQLGTTLNNGTDTATAPQQVSGLGATAAAVAVGGEHTCVLLTEGSVQCFGLNDKGQLGAEVGFLTTDAVPSPQTVAIDGVAAIAAGYNTTCVVSNSGSALCWGDGSKGELGFGSQFTNSPGGVNSNSDGTTQLTSVTSISQGNGTNDFFCATVDYLNIAGQLWCWGDNAFGQQGSGSTVGSPYAVQSPFTSGVSQVATGMMHTCLMRPGLATQCTGDNTWAQLGSPVTSFTSSPYPISVPGLSADRRLLDFQYYPLQVSMKKPDGSFTPFGTSPQCSEPSMIDSLAGRGVIATPAARAVAYCYDVAVSTRDPDTRELTRVILFAEDPRFTPISR